MLKRGFIAILVGGMALVGAGMAHSAGTDRKGGLSPTVARSIDGVAAEFTRHTREHRLMEVERNMHRQQRYDRRGGYDRRYGRGGPDYGYRRGYGPPPRGYGRGGGRMYNGMPVLGN